MAVPLGEGLIYSFEELFGAGVRTAVEREVADETTRLIAREGVEAAPSIMERVGALTQQVLVGVGVGLGIQYGPQAYHAIVDNPKSFQIKKRKREGEDDPDMTQPIPVSQLPPEYHDLDPNNDPWIHPVPEG